MLVRPSGCDSFAACLLSVVKSTESIALLKQWAAVISVLIEV